MRQYGEMFSILLLLCLTRSSLGEDITDTEEKDFTLSSEYVKFPEFEIREDGSFIYWICDHSKPSGVDCKLHLINRSTPEIVYPVKFATTGIQSRLLNYRSRGTKVLCLLIEQNSQGERYISTYIHDLSSNKTAKLALPSDLNFKQYIGIYFDGNATEVVMGNHTVCGKFTRCKLVFDSQGQLVQKPVPFPFDFDKIQFYQRASMDHGLFAIGMLKQDQMVAEATYFEPNGNLAFVKKLGVLKNPVMLAHTEGLYGYCVQFELDEKFGCTQFDWKSKSTVTMNFTVDDLGKGSLSPKISSFANLNNSRFLFVTLDCGKNRGSECKSAQAVTVNSHGNSLKTTPVLNKLKCRNQNDTYSAIDEVGDQFCVYVVCITDPKISESVHLYTRCIQKSTF